MRMTKNHPGNLVVVCDGRKAMILERSGGRECPNLQMREILEQTNVSTREQGADAPDKHAI